MRLFAGALLFASLMPMSQAWAGNAVIERAVVGFVRPAYDRLADTTRALEAEMTALCAMPSADGLETARDGFRTAVESWSRVEIIRFGPVTEDNRLERLLFWPDRKGIGLKQVQAALAGEDASALDAAALAGKSVAMQGFGALEYVLFGTGADDLAKPGRPYRCGYGKTIAGNIASIATDTAAAWRDPEGFAVAWMGPAASNPIYHTDAEALTELLDTLVHGLEMLRDVRINGFLGKDASGDRPRQAIFWRARATIVSLEGNLAGLRQVMTASGIRDNLPANGKWIADSVEAQFTNGVEALERLDAPVESVLDDPARRERLSFARDVTTSLSATIGTRLAGELGLTAGFSSLDGD